MILLPVTAFFPTVRVQDDEVSLVTGGEFEQELSSDWVVTGVKSSLAKSSDKKPRKMLHVQGDAAAKTPGTIQVKSSAMVHLGDSIYFRAWIRDANSAEDHGDVEVKVFGLEEGKKPLIDRKFRVWHQWKEFKFAADTDDFYLPGQLNLSLQFSPSASVDLSSVRLLDMGDTPASALAQSTDDEPKKPRKSKKGS